ncbi:MAG: DUF6702 family protein [Pseudomonadota bacterium]
MILRLFIASWCVIASLAGVASAHQQKTALTEVLFNQRTGNIEVAHRFIVHDAEHAIRVEFGIAGDLVTDAETQAAFATYVAESFALSGGDGIALPLSVIGSEVSEGYFWVYQETTAPNDIKTLTIRAEALRDVWPDQVNRVNIEYEGTVRTLVFSSATQEQSLDLEN